MQKIFYMNSYYEGKDIITRVVDAGIKKVFYRTNRKNSPIDYYLLDDNGYDLLIEPGLLKVKPYVYEYSLPECRNAFSVHIAYLYDDKIDECEQIKVEYKTIMHEKCKELLKEEIERAKRLLKYVNEKL